MLNGNQEQIKSASVSGQLVRVAVVLVALLLLSGAVTVQAQKVPFSFTAGEWSQMVVSPGSPSDHTAYYLPYYDGDRLIEDWFLFNFYRCCRANPYEAGYWYPWSFHWGRYDVPNSSWWSFGEGFVDEYGTGGIWTAGEPVLRTELKAIQTIEREMQATRASRATQRMTHYRGTRSSGISASRGGSKGSSGGGGSIGSSGGGGGRSGKK